MTLMGGPIDTRVNPTAVNTLANSHDLDWFRQNVIMTVPFPHPGFMREVYPGFLQISGFLSMNLDRHLEAHRDFFRHLVDGDGDSAEKHREFYDEYLAVMDLTAEFYLQTVDTVFIRHALPEGEMMHRGEQVDPARDPDVALLTVEGENDDISGVGQTEAAHDICTGIPAEMTGALSAADRSATTASSTARASAPRSRRASADFIATHGRPANRASNGNGHAARPTVAGPAAKTGPAAAAAPVKNANGSKRRASPSTKAQAEVLTLFPALLQHSSTTAASRDRPRPVAVRFFLNRG